MTGWNWTVELQSQEDAWSAFTAPEQDWSEVCEKITSVTRATALIDGRPYGVYFCRSKSELNSEDIEDLEWYCRDQWEPGWGEGYAHCPKEGSSLGLYIHFWQDDGAPLLTREQLEAVHHTEHRMSTVMVTEVTPDTFWTSIAQAKDVCGQDQRAAAYWLKDRLLTMGPKQAQNFDYIVHAYSDLAYKYGLWTAASVMLDGCTDDGFIDFRGWLIAQGKDIYFAALKAPDSLAGIPLYGDCCFESLAYVGDRVYEKLTGTSAYYSFDRPAYEKLKQELARDIQYGDGVDYPYKWSETAAYLPKLCAKYMTQEELAWKIQYHDDTWNINSPDIQAARATTPKNKKIKKNRGDSR